MIYKCLLYLSGLITLSLGVVLMIKAKVGIAPWDAVNVSLKNEIGMSIGFWVFAVGSVLILVNALIKRGMPNFLGFIPIVIIGIMIDGWNMTISINENTVSLTGEWLLFCTGLLVLSSGIALYIRSSLPMVPNDEFMIELSKRTGWSLAWTKTCGEGLAWLIAFLLKGPIGIGTLLVLGCLGILIHTFSRFMDWMKIPKY